MQTQVKCDGKLECLGLNVILSPTMKFKLIVIYNPPSHRANFYDDFKSLLMNIDNRTECIIMGDININWQEKNNNRTKLKALMDKFKYKQMINTPTRITRHSATLIDLIFVNRPERITKTYNLITGLTDHNMTLVVRKLTKKRFINHNKAENKMKTGIPKAKMNSFENELNQINWNSTITETDLNLSASKFVNKINDVINKHTKTWTRKPRKYSLPWFNNDIRLKAKNRDLALKKFLKSRNNTDHLIFTGLRNKVISELRKAKTKYFIQMIEEANGNSSKLWHHINKLTNHNKKNHQMIDCLKIDDDYVNDSQLIANELNNFFVESVYDLEKTFKGRLPSENKVQFSSINSFKIRGVSHDEVKKTIVKMKDSTSRDMHNLNVALIKNHLSSLLDPITHLVNLSIQTNTFPQSWKIAVITPIYKSGDKDKACNYRPISILPVVSKVLEKIVAEQLIEHLENNQLLNPQQFGFRKKTQHRNRQLLFVGTDQRFIG